MGKGAETTVGYNSVVTVFVFNKERMDIWLKIGKLMI